MACQMQKDSSIYQQEKVMLNKKVLPHKQYLSLTSNVLQPTAEELLPLNHNIQSQA